jgi:hypothetical protein
VTGKKENMTQLFLTWINRIMWLAIVLMWPLQVNSRPILDVQSATNADGSAVRIQTITDKQREERHVKIFYRSHQSGRMKLVASISRSMAESPAAGMTQILDWDRNGMHEISFVEECGAGPNCDGILYRINKSAELVVLFQGNSTIVDYINGHFIDYGRNNCCSWIASAHLVSKDRLHIQAKPAFNVFVGYEYEDSKSKPKFQCRFYRHGPSGEELTVSVEKKKFNKICKFYEHYR